MRRLPIEEVVRLLHAPGRRHRAIMVLHAFFDESGIHGGAPATDIAGFVGRPDEWAAVEAEWRSYLDSKGVAEFHYFDFEDRTAGTPWEKMERWERDPIRARLADILGDSPLVPLNAGYRGKWKRQVVDQYHPNRYPTSYSFCFEIVMELAIKCSEEHYDGEPIAVMFALSGEHSGRVLEYFDMFKQSGAWDLIQTPLAFDSPANRDALQCADMLAYECYQLLKAGTGTGYEKWPLMNALWRGPGRDGDPRSTFIIFQDEPSMIEVLKRPPLGRLGPRP